MNAFHCYEPHLGHSLPHDPHKAIVAPRPIGWTSIADKNGNVNLAPYSFFNLILSKPPRILVSPAALECRAIEIKQLSDLGGECLEVFMVIGQILKTHIRTDCLKDGIFDIASSKTIARAGYRGDYVLANQTFELSPSE